MSVKFYIINNELHTFPINIDIERNATFNDVKEKYFQNIELSLIYEKAKFHFFVDEKKINFNEKISNYISANYNILGIVIIYDYDNNFTDTTNVIVQAKDYSVLKNDFYMYISYEKHIIELKQIFQKYLNKNNIIRDLDNINIIFYGKVAKSESQLKDYINYSKHSLCTIRY
jgi:hypothetical protein